jgi:hypothetical protein
MKQPYPWFRSGRGWYVEIGQQQHFLGSHPNDAPPPQKSKKTRKWNAPVAILDAFHKLMAEGGQPCQTLPPKRTVADVCRAFLAACCPYEPAAWKELADKVADAAERRRRSRDLPLRSAGGTTPDTYWWYHSYLEDFCNHLDGGTPLGLLSAVELRPFHVTRWLDGHPGWTTGRGCAIRAIKRAFNWADDEGFLRPNPIKAVKRQRVPSRGRTLTRDERREILAAIDDEEFRNFVEAMQESGARPSHRARCGGPTQVAEMEISTAIDPGVE